MEVNADGKNVKVTPIEFKILLLLIRNPGRVFPAEEIYERVWNERAINTDTVMVHIRNLREKSKWIQRSEIHKGGVGCWIQT